MSTILSAILLLGICMLLFCIGQLLGRGPFRPGHACRMNVTAKGKGARRKNQKANKQTTSKI